MELSFDTCHLKRFKESREGGSFTPFWLVVAATEAKATQGQTDRSAAPGTNHALPHLASEI